MGEIRGKEIMDFISACSTGHEGLILGKAYGKALKLSGFESILVTAPTGSDKNTHRYNPFFYVSTNPDLRIRDLQLIAEIVIPAERVDSRF